MRRGLWNFGTTWAVVTLGQQSSTCTQTTQAGPGFAGSRSALSPLYAIMASSPFDASADQNGESVRLPQFNLSPSVQYEAKLLEEEEHDNLGDMPILGPPMSFKRPGSPLQGLHRSATRMARLQTSARAAGSLQKSFSHMNSSEAHQEFQSQVWLESAGKLASVEGLPRPDIFEKELAGTLVTRTAALTCTMAPVSLHRLIARF